MAEAPQPSSLDSTLHVTGAHAVVEWTGPDAQPRYLCQSMHDVSRQVTFVIQYDASLGTAFFKIRAPVGLKAAGYGRTLLYLHIPPSRITFLTDDTSEAAPDVVKTKLGSNPRRFQFSLDQPADLIVPPVTLAPQNRSHGEIMDSLKLLAQETRFSVYFTHAALPEPLLQSLCARIRSLNPSNAAADLRGLYGGAGGKALAGAELCSPAPPNAAPPSYDELGPSPPGPHSMTDLAAKLSVPSKKRRRGSASTPPRMCEPDVAAICRKLVDEALSRNREQDRAEFQDRLKEMQKNFTTQLQELKSTILTHLDQRLEELEGRLCSIDDVDEHITQHVYSFEDLIEVKIEDHVTGIKVELEDFVDNEVANAEDRVMQRVRDASWTVNIDE